MDDVKLTDNKITKSEAKEEQDQIPKYNSRLELSDKQKKRIVEEIKCEVDAIEEERKKYGIIDKFEALESQYETGLIQEYEEEDQQFNVHSNITRKDVDDAVNRQMQAIFETDPRFSISPRPEFEGENGDEVAEAQEDFLDYELDENVPLKAEMWITLHNANLLGLGWLKLSYKVERDKRRREEVYEGNPKPIIEIDPNSGQPVVVGVQNDELDRFMRDYPDDAKKYPGYIKKLSNGEKINIVANYVETTYNAVFPKTIHPKNILIRYNVDSYQALCGERLIGEIQEYSYWELKKLESKSQFFDIDKIIKDKDGKNIENYSSKCYKVNEYVYQADLEEDGEYTKCKFWIETESQTMIGAQLYPNFSVDCEYIPFNIKRKKKTLYQPGMAEDIADDNIAMDALINMLLESIYMRNIITPVTDEGSTTDRQFIEKRFCPGLPIVKEKGEQLDFLQKYMPAIDVGGVITMLQYIRRSVEDKTKISSGMSGKESSTDPNAPAAKTAMLLSESNINFRAYIIILADSFNLVGTIMLALYHQHSEEGRKYRKREMPVAGNPFGTITRAQMRAKTNVQSQAYAFALDKVNEKREFIALYGMIRQDPVFAQNPKNVYNLVRIILKAWNSKTKNKIDMLLPKPEEFDQEVAANTAKGVMAYLQAQEQKAAQGIQPKIDPEMIFRVAQIMAKSAATPLSDQEKQFLTIAMGGEQGE